MTDLKSLIDKNKIPSHIAIIMDGNGRWAKKRGSFRIFGHQNAITSVKDSTESCAELGVQYLTLYAFSTENWSRPKEEVTALMELLVATIQGEISALKKNNVRLEVIGDFESLPVHCQESLQAGMKETADSTGLILTLALSYSGRWDITRAVKKIAEAVAEGKLSLDQINEQTIKNFLSTASIPDPELMIRTSGELRLSNFLLWELAYAELYVTETLWPDFKKEDLYKAVLDYQKRERRFGKTSEQLNEQMI
ncbi:MAG: isoprenyl transferase [Cytophagaceae bacterium]|nr:isoprenyl transferase [Cytophagaceae bacterium]